MDAQERGEFQRLQIEFETHVALSEERFNTLFREQREMRKADLAVHREIKESIDRLNKLVWSVGGSTILILFSALLAVIMK